MSDKKEFHYFVLPEYEEEEQYLREMANKGYLLEKVSAVGVYQFKKSEPVDMIKRILIRKMMPMLAVFLLPMVPQAYRMIELGQYTDPFSLAFYVIWLFSLILYIYLVVRCTIGFMRLKKRLMNNNG